MKITFRWYSEGHDPIPLRYIEQTPEVSGIMGALSYKAVDVLWEEPETKDLAGGVHVAGLECEVTRFVNAHEDTKLGLPIHGKYINAYNKILEDLAKYNVKVVVYNLMSVLDRLCTDLAYETEDGLNCLCYDYKKIEGMSPRDIVELIAKEPGGLTLPGQEPKHLADLSRIMSLCRGVDYDAIRANYRYFLEGITPVAKKVGIKMAHHPDDPAWDLFGLPRIYRNRDNMDKTAKLCDSDSHGFCICVRSLGSNVGSDIPVIVHELEERERLYVAHVCSAKHIEPKLFYESPYPSSCGDLGIYVIMEAIYETSPNAYIHPDHGRMIWGEAGRPGYPLYDRALGAVYLVDLREVTEKTHKGE